MVFMAGCTGIGPEEKNQLTVSILPQKYFLDKLVGEDFQVNVMVPESQSPAIYEPTPRQMQELGSSVIYFAIGSLEFERAWMDKIQSANKDMVIVNTSNGVSLIRDQHGHGVDPHYWMSPGACFQMAINMKEELVKRYPEKATLYEKRLSDIQQEIAGVDFQMRDILADLEQRKFLIYHPSLAYFARDYNLEQLPIELHGKEPSMKYIQEIIRRAKKAALKNVLVQQQSNTESAETIAGELGGEIILFNPLTYDWDQELITLAKKIQRFSYIENEQ